MIMVNAVGAVVVDDSFSAAVDGGSADVTVAVGGYRGIIRVGSHMIATLNTFAVSRRSVRGSSTTDTLQCSNFLDAILLSSRQCRF